MNAKYERVKDFEILEQESPKSELRLQRYDEKKL
jgi:hypothetical protein